MYSLIIKITHNVRVKDSIAVGRGLFRVATAIVNPEQTNSSSWMNLPKTKNKSDLSTQKAQKPIKKTQQQSKEAQKAEIKKEYLQNFNLIKTDSSYHPSTSQIPASRIGRLFQFGKLGLSIASASIMAGDNKNDQYYESVGNNISNQLCKMRGAPLKLAQMMSIQEDKLIPAPIRLAFQRARESAHVIPYEEVCYMMEKSLGVSWKEKFKSFKHEPFASASIGQVHKAILPNEKVVAVKVQYKSVKESIDSDIDNLSLLLKIPKIFPKGMYVERILQKTKEELMRQCDYLSEKDYQTTYEKRLKKCLKEQAQLFKVPEVYQEFTTGQIFTSEYLEGIKMKDIEQQQYSQQLKNQIGRRLMLLTFKELFQMGIMQSDPNPSNFTFNPTSDQLNLFDFGATHQYKEQFLRNYYEIIQGSVEGNQDKIWEASIKAGFVTGEQNSIMKKSHIESIIITGEPLRHEGVYDFGSQAITKRIYETIPVMLKNRIKPPPQEIYSLHRKLSGSYLACIRLGAKVNCHQIFKQIKFQTSRD